MVSKSLSIPQFIQPKEEYQELTKPPSRNNLPAKSLKEQKHDFKIYEILEKAKALSNGLVSKYKEASKNTTYRETLKEARQVKQPTYCAAHIIESDAEYVSIVHSMSITDKGALSLLLANGGSEYIDRGFTPAQAFDLLRNNRMKKLLPPPGKDCDRHQKIDGKVYLPGAITDDDRWRKVLQSRVKDKE